jgi:glucose-1-phosphate thymidylyltransferase
MRGIILAGGNGTRLRPLTSAVSKQLLPIFNKPLVYYPLSTLMLAGIKEILVIVKKGDLDVFRSLLGDGSQWGISLSFLEQFEPKGIAQGLILGEEFLAGDDCAYILGDNLFYGTGLGRTLSNFNPVDGAQIFAYEVSNPSDYGVVEINGVNEIISIEEKPQQPKSNFAITGLYFFDKYAPELAKRLIPSGRNELEITDLNRLYLSQNQLKVTVLPRGTAWLDTGTFEGLQDAGTFVRIIEERQGTKVGDPGEISRLKGWT